MPLVLKAEKMERGRGQVLQRYRPDQTFDHESHFIARVTDYRVDRSYDQDLPRTRLIEEAIRFVRRWRRDGVGKVPGRSDAAPTFPPDGASAGFYEVVVPLSLNFAYYPLSVTCGNAQCRRVYVLPRAPEPGQEIGNCPSCDHPPSYQTQYLLVHGCGYAKGFEPPRTCDNCSNAAFRLDNRASRFRDFRWQCMRCGAARELNATAICNNQNCRFPNKAMQPEVHTSGAAYVPHTVRIVNPASPDDPTRTNTPEYRLGLVGRWLNVCSQEDLESLQSGSARPMDSRVRELIETLRVADPAKAAEIEVKFAPLDLDGLRARIETLVGPDLVNDDDALIRLAAQLETYSMTLRRNSVNIARLDAEAPSDTRRALYRRYPRVFREAGLDPDGIVLVPEFPVIELAVGYSRGGYTAKDADIRSYRGAPTRGQAGKTTLYAHPQRTEALVVGLDRARVARWLDVNNLASTSETGGADGVIQWFARYLLRRGDEIEWIEFSTMPAPEDRAGDALVRLIHSMSHQVIRALSVDSGFMETSLSEHFFPYHLSFAAYPRANGEFVIGGLRTVMEQNLDEIVRTATENDACLYDPNCLIANRGADHGCLFLPETACSFRNRNAHLSRWELFGSLDRSIVGYWDPSLATP